MNPSSMVKIALGKQLLKFAKIELKNPLALKSYLELGQLFCDVFNGETIIKPSTDTVEDITYNCSEFSVDPQRMMATLKIIMAEDDARVMQLPDEKFITDTEQLKKISDITTKVHRHGLESVVTPAIKEKLDTVGIPYIEGCHQMELKLPEMLS